MSFNKNPPWARNSGSSMSNNTPMGVGVGNYGNYGGGGIQQQQILNQMNQGNVNPLFQAVSYPTPRSLNTMAFAQGNNSQQSNLQAQQSTGQSQSKFNPTQRGFSGTGVVTKIQNDFGFIDEEIFFHKNICVKGNFPKIGERVLVEATYNANMSTKWNATRVQVLSSGGSSNSSRNSSSIPSLMGNSSGKGYNAVPPPERERESRFDEARGRDPRKRELSPLRRSPDRPRESRVRDTDSQESDRKRRREDREKDRHRHSPDVRRESRRPVPERRRKPVARYMVQIPKISLAMVAADVLELKRRYTNLYVPSDFFNTQIRWIDAFPANSPFSIQKPCAFHVLHKDVDSPFENDAVLDPPDADYLFSAKVMLMGTPPIQEMYQKCFANAEDKEKEEEREFIHPARLINFLVGTRGKNETMAIGGPWSPSLDGENPKTNPNVLIKTAIRNCKALTGIDLSDCTRWYRFVELYYRRTESHKGRLTPARVETVVIFLPDIRSCQPTRIEWENINSMYKNKLESVIKNYNNQKVDEATAAAAATTPKSPSTKEAEQSSDAADAVAVATAAEVADTPVAVDGAKVDDPDNKLKDSEPSPDDMHAAAGNEKDDENDVAKSEPSHYSTLDPKTMKVTDLRVELEARSLSSKGLKAQLMARLIKVLKSEETEEIEKAEKAATAVENGNAADEETKTTDTDEAKKADVVLIDDENVEESVDFDISEVTVIDEYKAEEKAPKKEEVRKMDERERAALEKKYTLPTGSHIVVHPNRTAKSGKFDCTVMSLSLLLDYRPEDTKEHSFEVSLFAELFNEMLLRDFGFNIYKALALLPEKVKEEEKKKDDKKPKSEEGKEKDAEAKTDEKTEKSDEKAEATKPAEPTETVDEKKAEKEKDKEEKEKSNKRSRPDDSADDDTSRSGSDRKKKDSKEKEKEKERPKLVTVDPELLLSFVYFDQTQCGYIFEKDIEDLFYTLGLSLSRAQTRKLAGKALTRDSLHYRKLTDKPKEDEAAAVVVPGVPGDEDSTLVELAKGNNVYLPTTSRSVDRLTVGVPPAKRSKTENHDDGDDAVVSTKNGMVMFNGALVDLKKLMDQMERSDRARDDTEQILSDIRKVNVELTSSNSKATTKIKDLQSDVKSLSRKLTDTEQSLNTANRKGSEYYSVLASIHDRVSPMFVKAEKRTETTRDKDRDKDSPKIRDAKDKEREKDVKEKDKDHKEKDKDVKDVKDAKEKDVKEVKEKDVKDVKEKEVKDVKDVKDTKEKETKDKVKDVKEKDNKEKISKDKIVAQESTVPATADIKVETKPEAEVDAKEEK